MSFDQIKHAFGKALSAFCLVFTAAYFFCYFSSRDFDFGLVAWISVGFAVGTFAREVIASMGPQLRGQESHG